ncbi:MAG: DUF6702 family protein [Bacteroidia bacterium]
MIKLFISLFALAGSLVHPFYMSVTEINHNAKTKSIEVSCHIFTDDLEKDFKIQYNKSIDLTHPTDKALADKYVSDYLKEKLKITIDGKIITLHYLGYEINEDAVWSYFECENIATIKNVKVYDAILFDKIEEQANLVHITVNGKRQSFKLDNPKADAVFSF